LHKWQSELLDSTKRCILQNFVKGKIRGFFMSILWYKIYMAKLSPSQLIKFTLEKHFSPRFSQFFLLKKQITGANLFHLTSLHAVIHLSKAQLSSIRRHLSRSPNLAFFWGTLQSTLNRGDGDLSHICRDLTPIFLAKKCM
jgi:hypothetical protein